MSARLFGLLALAAAGAATVPVGADPPSETLAGAREDLVVAELTIERIERALNALRDQPDADPLVLADYQAYYDAVCAMAEKQQEVVRAMAAVNDGNAPIVDDGAWPQPEADVFAPPLPESTDELARLERELTESLQEFDAFLLREQYEAARRMDRIDEASSEEMTGLAQEAADAVERLRDRGIDIDTSAPPSDSQGQSQSQSPGQGQDQSQGGGMPGQEQGSGGQPQAGDVGDMGGDMGGEMGGEQEGDASGGGSTTRPEGEEGEGESGPPDDGTKQDGTGEGADGTRQTGGGAAGSGESSGPSRGGTSGTGEDVSEPVAGDRPPADDDDIVARQLREAAERETDPVLKEKLWEEYDRYKGNK